MNIAGLGGGKRAMSPHREQSSPKKIKLSSQPIESFKLFGQIINITSDNTPVESMGTQLIAGHNLLKEKSAKELAEKNSDKNIASTSHPLNLDDQEKLTTFEDNPIANMDIASTRHPLNPYDQNKLTAFENNPIKEFFPFEFETNERNGKQYFYAKGCHSSQIWSKMAGYHEKYWHQMQSNNSQLSISGFIRLVIAYQKQRNSPQKPEPIVSIVDDLQNIPMDQECLNALADAKAKFIQIGVNFSETCEHKFHIIQERIKNGEILSLKNVVHQYNR